MLFLRCRSPLLSELELGRLVPPRSLPVFFPEPLAGGAGRSLRGTAGLLRSLSEQALLNEVPSLLDVGVDDGVAGDVFSAAAGLFGEDFCSFLAETVPPVDSSRLLGRVLPCEEGSGKEERSLMDCEPFIDLYPIFCSFCRVSSILRWSSSRRRF